MSRKRHPTCIKEDNSEKYEVPPAKRLCTRRKKETIDTCNSIRGGDSKDKGPALDGMWLTLVNESTPVRLANYVNMSHKMMSKVVPKVCKRLVRDFESSKTNQVRSLKVLYSKGLLSKEKYKAVRLNLTMTPKKSHKNVSLKFMPGVPLPKLLPYDKLMQFVKSVDIGNVRDMEEDFCSDLEEDEQVHGVYRELEEYLLELAKMYIHIDQGETFLLHFSCEPFHFRVAVGADGAPFGKDDEATAWLISFLNVGERIASESENFLIAGANCSESHVAMIRYARKLVSDIAYVEKQNYSLPDSDHVLKFTFELVPADMKWAATFCGEISNSAFYFSSFGNVNDDSKSTIGGSLGKDKNCTWTPWDYQSRLNVASKVNAKKVELEKSSYAESTKRNKLLNFIKSNNSRQEYEPILGQLVDKVYAEPPHNGNNAWQQLHEAMLSHAISKSNIPTSCKCYPRIIKPQSTRGTSSIVFVDQQNSYNRSPLIFSTTTSCRTVPDVRTLRHMSRVTNFTFTP